MTNQKKPFLIPLKESSIQKFTPFLKKSNKIILFDIDNTLYCSSLNFDKVIKKRINNFAKSIGITDVNDICSKYTKQYGLALKGILRNYPNTDPKDFFDKVEGGIEINEFIKKDNELINTLNLLGDYKLYCFTNAYFPHALNVLEAMDISHYFSGIFYCDYTSCGTFLCKPDYFAYKTVNEILDKSEIYFYDDSLVNVKMGNEIGWKCELICRDYNIKMALNKLIYMANKNEIEKPSLVDMIESRYVEEKNNVEKGKSVVVEDVNETKENKA